MEKYTIISNSKKYEKVWSLYKHAFIFFKPLRK